MVKTKTLGKKAELEAKTIIILIILLILVGIIAIALTQVLKRIFS